MESPVHFSGGLDILDRAAGILYVSERRSLGLAFWELCAIRVLLAHKTLGRVKLSRIKRMASWK